MAFWWSLELLPFLLCLLHGTDSSPHLLLWLLPLVLNCCLSTQSWPAHIHSLILWESIGMICQECKSYCVTSLLRSPQLWVSNCNCSIWAPQGSCPQPLEFCICCQYLLMSYRSFLLKTNRQKPKTNLVSEIVRNFLDYRIKSNMSCLWYGSHWFYLFVFLIIVFCFISIIKMN
jgi:hypothetical protein